MSEREMIAVEEVPPQFEAYGEVADGRPLHVSVGVLFNKLELLWAHRRTLFRNTLIAMVVAAGLALVVPNRYTATVCLNPPDSNPMSGLTMLMGLKSGGAAAALGGMGDMLGLKSPGQLYIQQLQSRAVLDRIITRFDLQKVYRTKTREKTRKDLVANTTAEENRQSGVITISVIDKDRIRAAQMANAYADELGQLIANVNAASGRREREYFEAQLSAAQGDLDQASKQLSEFGSKNTTLDIGEQGKALVDAVANIEGQLIASESELKSLLLIYTGKHERVQQTRAKIAVLRRQLEQMSGKQPSSDSKTGDAKSGDGSNPFDPSVKRLWGVSVPYMQLYRQVKIQEAVVETLTQQYELAKLQEARRVSDVQVFDPADVPEKKSSPHRLLITLAVGLFAFICSSGFVMASAWWKDTDPEDPWRKLLAPAVLKLDDSVIRTKLRLSPARIGFVRRLRERRGQAGVEQV